MQQLSGITGMILKTVPIGEYDRRIVILTKERGKISAFVKGARRQNSRFLATTTPFCFGTFQLYEGRTSYNVMDLQISHYFEDLRSDYIGAFYGMYFLEVADYYTRENNDEKQMLKLLFQSLRALTKESLMKPLVKCIFECKAMVINGEFPGIPKEKELDESTCYALTYIQNSPIEKLYTFTVKEQVLKELIEISNTYCKKIMDTDFKSLEILKSLC